ncbi:class I SAM-dependent methyltransferase [Maribacter algicola]|uniref:Class I SAM-dependent methyltransferase n=1 Tax=Meishania litoralis TaxID=3434685 RepID=A0ACC7LNM7_9FLAO
MNTFKTVKKKFKSAFEEILAKENNYEIDEAALPAYAHKNVLIDYLFWKRIRVAFDFGNSNGHGKKVLDFGCGSGVLSYLLAQNDYEVTACDLEFGPLNLVREKIEFPKNIDFVEGDIATKDFPDGSFDLIFALDVLEHVENLEDYIRLFNRLLTPNGIVIVSGPTENILYKIGRKFAGDRFTGDYHVTNIASIKDKFNNHNSVRTVKKLIVPFVLFEVFAATKNKLSNTNG